MLDPSGRRQALQISREEPRRALNRGAWWMARGAWRVREGVGLDGVDWEGGTQSQTLLIRLAWSF